MTSRIQNNESTIFIGIDDDQILGFGQSYPSFCSVEAVRFFILYDRFVDSRIRNPGIGASLMNKASRYSRDHLVSCIDLMAEVIHYSGQPLSENSGYKKVNQDFRSCSMDI